MKLKYSMYFQRYSAIHWTYSPTPLEVRPVPRHTGQWLSQSSEGRPQMLRKPFETVSVHQCQPKFTVFPRQLLQQGTGGICDMSRTVESHPVLCAEACGVQWRGFSVCGWGQSGGPRGGEIDGGGGVPEPELFLWAMSGLPGVSYCSWRWDVYCSIFLSLLKMVQDIKGHSVIVEGRVTYYRKCRVVSFEYPSVILQFFLNW